MTQQVTHIPEIKVPFSHMKSHHFQHRLETPRMNFTNPVKKF